MSQSAARRMTVQEFLAWEQTQEERFELIDGRPVAMTGATIRRDRVVVNTVVCLATQLRAANSLCEVFTSDVGIITSPHGKRRPDAAIGCPPFDEAATATDSPVLVLEVLSRSTQSVDQFVKLLEYQQLPALQCILLVNPAHFEVGVWTRAADAAWTFAAFREPADVIEIPALGLRIPLADIYRGVPLAPPPPRLVWPDPPDR